MPDMNEDLYVEFTHDVSPVQSCVAQHKLCSRMAAVTLSSDLLSACLLTYAPPVHVDVV
jgi:hypothetical protein